MRQHKSTLDHVAQILELPTLDQRQAAIEQVPERHRETVKRWVLFFWRQRKKQKETPRGPCAGT